MMLEYRSLTVDEIAILERRGCRADDWSNIYVADDFDANYVSNVSFMGTVNMGVFDKNIEIEPGIARHSGIHNAALCNTTIGDNCLIENIGCYISGYSIGEECYIANVGRMASDGDASFGTGNRIAVMNEAGKGNIVTYDGLTSQMAALMVATGSQALLSAALRNAQAHRPESGTVGYGVKITNTREIVNTVIGDDTEINGASRLADCTVNGSLGESVYIGNDVICENTVIAAGASVTGGAHVYNCYIGEACHIGKGFTAESSVFFANSHMDNGEACASFCGPFTVSHHKSTLLIGGIYSFYNAGSATNFSNHAYKLGPIHSGTLRRGSKTASGAHLLWPADIGAFSVCLGKIQSHPDTSALPFSYVIGTERGTVVAPGCNLATIGTRRDTAKWSRRDRRPHAARRDIINYDWLSPYVVQKTIDGKRLLERLAAEQGTDVDTYSCGAFTITNRSLKRGIKLYDMAAAMFFADALSSHDLVLPTSTTGTGAWTDLAGMLVPEAELAHLMDNTTYWNIDDIEEHLSEMHAHYAEYRWNYAYTAMLAYYGIDNVTRHDADNIIEKGNEARARWKDLIAKDAEKDALLAKMNDDETREIISKIENEE